DETYRKIALCSIVAVAATAIAFQLVANKLSAQYEEWRTELAMARAPCTEPLPSDEQEIARAAVTVFQPEKLALRQETGLVPWSKEVPLTSGDGTALRSYAERNRAPRCLTPWPGVPVLKRGDIAPSNFWRTFRARYGQGAILV